MEIREIIHRGGTVKFSFYRDGNLWYQTNTGFKFPVPISDTGTGTFKVEDKSILFMRWIRKHLNTLQERG